MTRPALALVTALAMAGLAACGPTPAASDTVTLGEYFVTAEDSRAPGPAELTVANAGQFPHTLVVTRQSGEVVAATDIIPAGGTVTATFDLAPGDYQFTCRIVAESADGSIVDHFEKGMRARVTVRG